MVTQAVFQTIEDSTENVIIPIYYRDAISLEIMDRLGLNFSRLINRRRGVITKVATRGSYKFPFFVFLGLGERKTMTTLIMREMFGKLFRHLQESAVVLAHQAALNREGLTEPDLADLITQCFVLTNYEVPHYKFKRTPNIHRIQILSSYDIRTAISRGLDYSESVNFAKDLGNTSRYLMNPSYLEKQARRLARKYRMELEVLNEAELEQIEAKAFLAQSMGSKQCAKMMILRYQTNKNMPLTALIGKGLTYDTGEYRGRAANIRNVRFDICGATSILGVMEIIARRNVDANIIAIIPAAENRITVDNYREYGVLPTMSGKTVEITYADLEGRLMLCDAITYAGKLGASRILEVATIAGNCWMAMDDIYTGMFCNDDHFYQEFMQAVYAQDEKCWRLPMDDAFAQMIYETNAADIANSAGTSIGANIGACFLKQFIPKDVQWLHLDIAQCSMPSKERPHVKVGATGAMIRSIAQMFEHHALS